MSSPAWISVSYDAPVKSQAAIFSSNGPQYASGDEKLFDGVAHRSNLL
jgi:hypothetical protein